MSRDVAARWGKLGNYDNGWGICARELRDSPYFADKNCVCTSLRASASARIFSRWLLYEKSDSKS